MKLVQNFLTKNDCYKSGRKITVKGLMLHSVGCSQPNASVFVKNWNRSGLEACVHGFIDGNTGTVYQTLPCLLYTSKKFLVLDRIAPNPALKGEWA